MSVSLSHRKLRSLDVLAAGTSSSHVAMWKYSATGSVREPEDRWTLQPPCQLPVEGGISDIVVSRYDKELFIQILSLSDPDTVCNKIKLFVRQLYL